MPGAYLSGCLHRGAREDRYLSEFSAQTSTAFLPPLTVLSATPDRASPVPAHTTHSGSANPRHHTARRGLPRPSRHQVGSQHTGSLGGDECRDLPFYSRITTRTLTQLPIFPADDRCQGRTEQWLGLHCLPRTQEQGPNLPGWKLQPCRVLATGLGLLQRSPGLETPTQARRGLEVLTEAQDPATVTFKSLYNRTRHSVMHGLGSTNYNDIKKKKKRNQ